MKNIIAILALSTISSTVFAANKDLDCIAGKFANNGALASLSGAKVTVVSLRGNILSLHSLDETSMKMINRDRPLDEKLLTTYGNSSVITEQNSSIHSSWQVTEYETATVNIDLSILSGTITIDSKGPGFEGTMSEEVNCLAPRLN